jgi:hypothetical protein
VVVVLADSVQGRDGAKTTVLSMYLATPVRFVFADGGFAGKLVDWASRILATTLHIVRTPEGSRMSVVDDSVCQRSGRVTVQNRGLGR